MLHSLALATTFILLGLSQEVHGMLMDLQWSYQVVKAGDAPLNETQRQVFGSKFDQGSSPIFLYGQLASSAPTTCFALTFIKYALTKSRQTPMECSKQESPTINKRRPCLSIRHGTIGLSGPRFSTTVPQTKLSGVSIWL